MGSINKVIFGSDTLIDLTEDTVSPETLGNGVTAHDKSGASIVGTMESGGSLTPATKKEVNFYDYDGTILYSYTVAEAAALTELPALPSHEGLTCQGWNWSLADLKTANRKMNVGAMYITDDGKTRIYIRLEEGRTSPMLGVCPNGTVTVDWGDGTTPDTLTGTDTTVVQWTPNHAYAAPGEYVIKLTVDGTMGFYGDLESIEGGAILLYSSGIDGRNSVYRNSVQRIEIGNGVTSIGGSAFFFCSSLASIAIPDGIASIGEYAFNNCSSLASITIPDGVTSIGPSAFLSCSSLASIAIPDGVTSIDTGAVYMCYSLASITIPDGVTSIGESVFNSCYSLASITIPDGVTSIGESAFAYCISLSSITMPNGVTSIGQSAFEGCVSVAFYDFTACTTLPTLARANAFDGIAADCQIRVPASLVDAWKAATNWATYADYIVGV